MTLIRIAISNPYVESDEEDDEIELNERDEELDIEE
jgi:hypothetical protein